MILHARVADYGFALALPASMLAATAMLEWLPRWVTRRGGYGALPRAVGVCLMAGFLVVHLAGSGVFFGPEDASRGKRSRPFLRRRTRRLRGPGGRFLEQEVPAGQSLAALPEGVMLNFLSKRENPTPFVSFMPAELLFFGEQRMLHTFQAHPPDWILMVHRSAEEYGLRFFGRDYGRALDSWVRRNYEVVRLLGKPPLVDRQFGILILRHAPEGISAGKTGGRDGSRGRGVQ